MTLRGACLAALCCAGCSATPAAAPTPCNGVFGQLTNVPRTDANQLVIAGGPIAPSGIFDPSLLYPSGATSGVLAYSAVDTGAGISTAIALSNDSGRTWTGAGSVNAVMPLHLAVPPTSTRCPGGTCTGSLVHEVPSIVEDAADPDTSRRFKVFVHSYVVLPAGPAYDLGYLGLFTAPAPGGPWADEGKALGWLSESTFSSDDAGTLVTSIPALADCHALTEPGALLRGTGALDLAVGCAYPVGAGATTRVELLRSTDHGRTFTHVARLLTDADAAALGSSGGLNAADLFVAGGRTYLSVTPSGPTGVGFDGYRGCAIVALTVSGDAVERTHAGAPVVCRTLDGPGRPFAGACTYAEGASAVGYLLPQISLDGGTPYRIFTSGVLAP